MKGFFQHQRDIIQDDKKKTGIWLGTGSGKTLIALCLARKRTLVICPKTQKEDQNWEREAFKSKLPVNLTVMSKEEFRRDWEKLPRYDTIIADEAHTLLGVAPNTRQRNKVLIPLASQLYEAFMGYIEKHQPERLYLVTATIGKTPMTVWAASQALGHRDSGGEPWDFFEFRERFYTKLRMPGREVWAPRKDGATKELLARLIKRLGYVGRLEDYFDVPSQVYRTVHIELTEKQRKRIREMAIEYPDPIVRIGKIHQIENGVLAGNEFSAGETFDSNKVDKILEFALEFPKMIVFAKYTSQIDDIMNAVIAEGHYAIVLDGRTKDKGAVLADAKGRDEYIFIAQAQVSAGWELPECPTMVFASRTYSWVDYDQAVGRIQRANNVKKNLYINLVVKGGTDEAVHKCLEDKRDFNEVLHSKNI